MAVVAGPSAKPIHPLYCGVCTLPTEYCEFGASVTKCKAWLESKDKVEYDRLWGEGAPRRAPLVKLAYHSRAFTDRLFDRPDGYAVCREAGEDRAGCCQG